MRLQWLLYTERTTNVKARTLVGLVTLYCIASTRKHVLSIGDSFDVPYVSALCGLRLAMFSV